MPDYHATRRTFLKYLGIAGSLSLLHRRAPAETVQAPAATAVLTRPSIRSLDPNGPEIAALRQGIQTMQNRGPTDPTSWTYQANMHGTYDMPIQPLWQQCQHGSFFFLSWHRMYLYYFERILRAASHSSTLALPYWDYNDATQRALPVAFRQPADAANPLYVQERNQGTGQGDGINDGAELPPEATSHDDAFAYTNFSAPLHSRAGFGGQRVGQPVHSLSPHGALEAQPHDGIHDLVGGDGWMGDPNQAARDPIFWLHHANIDRLWQRWLNQGGRQNPINDSVWMNTPFSFFDESGTQVSITASAILSTEQLGYRYDDDPPRAVALRLFAALPPPPPPPPPSHPTLLAASSEPKVQLGAAPVTLALTIKPEIRPRLHALMQPLAKERMVLNIEGIRYPKNPGVYYEVYLNLPTGTKPDPKSIYHVGNLSFFGLKPHGGAEHQAMGGHESSGGKAGFEITDLVRELQKRSVWSEEKVQVTFVMRGLLPPKGKQTTPKPGTRAEFDRITLTSE